MAKQIKSNIPATESEQIEAWKKEYGVGNVFCVKIPHKNVDANTKLNVFIKKPSMTTMAKIARYGDEHIDKSVEILFEDSYLGGDPEINKYDEYKIALFETVMPMFEVPKAEIVKL